jgi:hypothetical protein
MQWNTGGTLQCHFSRIPLRFIRATCFFIVLVIKIAFRQIKKYRLANTTQDGILIRIEMNDAPPYVSDIL